MLAASGPTISPLEPLPGAVGADPGRPLAAVAGAPARQFIRGSSALAAGRLIAVVLNFAAQVLIVRYLSKADYGAFAYGVSFVTLSAAVILFGLGRSIPRLVPIAHEEKQYGRAFGYVVLAMGTIGVSGLLIVLLVHVLQAQVASILGIEAQTLTVVLIMVAMGPIEAYDNLLQHLAAAFAGARAIFIRRLVLGPALKVLAIGGVALAAGSVYTFAGVWVLFAAIGPVLYAVVLLRAWRREGVLGYFRLARLEWPVRELAAFSAPLMASELAVALRVSAAVFLLEYFYDGSSVAEYRAVLPVAGLNTLVFEAFGFLFVPLASRMFARRDYEGVSALYWQTSLWIAVLTFPIVAVTCSMATPLAILLFGHQYATAGTILAVLSVGYYVNAVLGFNAATLRVHGKTGIIATNAVISAILCVGISYVLIRRYGALGAAMSTAAAFVIENALSHFGLWRGQVGVRLLVWPFMRVYATLVGALALLLAVQAVWHPPLLVSLALAGLASVAVVRVTRDALKPGDVFPELLRMPLLKWLIG